MFLLYIDIISLKLHDIPQYGIGHNYATNINLCRVEIYILNLKLFKTANAYSVFYVIWDYKIYYCFEISV